MSLERYLKKQYELVFERHKKLVLAMNDCGVFNVYQFRSGLERVAKDEISNIEEEASLFWGRVDVQEALFPSGISVHRMLEDLRKVVNAENRRRYIKILRATCGPEKPAPDDAPIEVLDLPEAMKELFEKKNITELWQIVTIRERLECFYHFTPELLDEIEIVLSRVGRTFSQPLE